MVQRPSENLTAIPVTQSAWPSPSPPDVSRDFDASVYAAIND